MAEFLLKKAKGIKKAGGSAGKFLFTDLSRSSLRLEQAKIIASQKGIGKGIKKEALGKLRFYKKKRKAAATAIYARKVTHKSFGKTVSKVDRKINKRSLLAGKPIHPVKYEMRGSNIVFRRVGGRVIPIKVKK